jgi:hypothetical protein
MTTIQPSGRFRDMSLKKHPVAVRSLVGAYRQQNTITGFDVTWRNLPGPAQSRSWIGGKTMNWSITNSPY